MHKGTSCETLNMGKRRNCIFRSMPIVNILRVLQSIFGKHQFPLRKGTGDPTIEGHQVKCTPGPTPVSLMWHSKKITSWWFKLWTEGGEYREGSCGEKGQMVEKGNQELGRRDLRLLTKLHRTSSPVAFQMVRPFHCPPAPTHPFLIHCGEGAKRNGVRRSKPTESEAANSKRAHTTPAYYTCTWDSSAAMQ